MEELKSHRSVGDTNSVGCSHTTTHQEFYPMKQSENKLMNQIKFSVQIKDKNTVLELIILI